MTPTQQIALFNYLKAVNGLAYAVSSFAGTDAVKEVFETAQKLVATFDPEVRREVGWTGGDKP